MTGAVLAFMLGPSYELVKLKDHKENEVYLVDDSVRGWTISGARTPRCAHSSAMRFARSLARSLVRQLMGDGRARLVYTIPEAREGGADE